MTDFAVSSTVPSTSVVSSVTETTFKLYFDGLNGFDVAPEADPWYTEVLVAIMGTIDNMEETATFYLKVYNPCAFGS